MISLTPTQRRELRARAHPLHPVVAIGHGGLTPAVLHEIDVALKAHELVKVRVHADDRDEREAHLAAICEALAAAPVQHLGKMLIVWRPAPKKEPLARAKKPAKRGRDPRIKPGARRRTRDEPGKGARAQAPARRRAAREAAARDDRRAAPAAAQARRARRRADRSRDDGVARQALRRRAGRRARDAATAPRRRRPDAGPPDAWRTGRPRRPASVPPHWQAPGRERQAPSRERQATAASPPASDRPSPRGKRPPAGRPAQASPDRSRLGSSGVASRSVFTRTRAMSPAVIALLALSLATQALAAPDLPRERARSPAASRSSTSAHRRRDRRRSRATSRCSSPAMRKAGRRSSAFRSPRSRASATIVVRRDGRSRGDEALHDRATHYAEQRLKVRAGAGRPVEGRPRALRARARPPGGGRRDLQRGAAGDAARCARRSTACGRTRSACGACSTTSRAIRTAAWTSRRPRARRSSRPRRGA